MMNVLHTVLNHCKYKKNAMAPQMTVTEIKNSKNMAFLIPVQSQTSMKKREIEACHSDPLRQPISEMCSQRLLFYAHIDIVQFEWHKQQQHHPRQ
jgi:hypothetical protein